MKLSKFLVSVNLVAVMPIVAQGAAQAAEKAVSDKAAWLKENLSTVDKADKVKLKAQSACFAKPTGMAKLSNTPDGLTSEKQLAKIRPFIPNRKLPSEKDLNNRLVAQTPRLAEDPGSALSGKISAFYNSANPDFSSRSNPSIKPTANASINVKQISRLTRQAISAITNAQSVANQTHSTISPSVAPRFEPSEPEAQVPPQLGFPLMRQAERHLYDQSESSPEASADQSIIDRYAKMEIGDGSGEDAAADGGSDTFAAGTADSAGPPPFPLSLLPQASLKQLVRGMARPTRMNVAGRQPSFGSWRGGGMASTLRASMTKNLPQAGFHTYIRASYRPNNTEIRRRIASAPYSYAPRFIAKRTVRQAIPPQLFYRHNYFASRQLLGLQRHTPQPVNVAVYPAYNSQIRLY